MELRNLKASDMGQVCKILSGIGVRQFQGCFNGVDMKDKTVEQIGQAVVFDIAGIVLENIPKVQKDIDTFLASLTGKSIKDIQEMDMGDYFDLIVRVIQKDEFKDFFKHAMKLFNP